MGANIVREAAKFDTREWFSSSGVDAVVFCQAMDHSDDREKQYANPSFPFSPSCGQRGTVPLKGRKCEPVDCRAVPGQSLRWC